MPRLPLRPSYSTWSTCLAAGAHPNQADFQHLINTFFAGAHAQTFIAQACSSASASISSGCSSSKTESAAQRKTELEECEERELAEAICLSRAESQPQLHPRRAKARRLHLRPSQWRMLRRRRQKCSPSMRCSQPSRANLSFHRSSTSPRPAQPLSLALPTSNTPPRLQQLLSSPSSCTAHSQPVPF
ncbi:hypothetical protein DFH08DRAFT_92912 [Mycena albidolilacea]|uniref:Uncharacterized protein n=1 Tax=Mycena albidolilacea TaxID=1033008 RepID=A0AAD7A9G7_9AGAR|nr:hypothetical protein DFH08DRAFT_92912 [Mycena albidolilacea]